jgi:hypothetical protein
MEPLDRITKCIKSTNTPEDTRGSTSGNCGRIYRTGANGFECGKEEDFG